MPHAEARLIIVQECVEEFWATRSDGRFEALEHALVDILEPKKPGAKYDSALVTSSSAARVPAETRTSNVIVLVDRIRRRARRAAR